MSRFQISRHWLLGMALFACAGAASAQVKFSTAYSGLPGAVINATGTGFPVSPAPVAANVNVTITPPAGNGSPVTTAATAITPVVGSTYTVQFKVPTALATSVVLPCTFTVANAPGTTPVFTTLVAGTLTVLPPPTLLSVTPSASPLGVNGLTVAVVGNATNFTSATTLSLSLRTPGPPPAATTISEVAGSTVRTDSTHVKATFNIPNNDPLGLYSVIAQTGPETATLPGGFLLAGGGALSLQSVTPNNLPAGTNAATINVVGIGTHFVQGTTVAALGDGITVEGLGATTVTDFTHASFVIDIDPIAKLGTRTVTMTTGGEYATSTFTITGNGSTLTNVSITTPPAATSVPQGSNATLTLTGTGTHWIQAGTTVRVGGGTNVGNITVNSPTSLTVNISAGPGVAVGSYTVTATTNGEIVALTNAVAVSAATPYLQSVTPTSGIQGQQNLTLNITGVFTQFTTTTNGPLKLNCGSNLTTAVTASSATAASATLNIDPVAFTGGRTCTLSSNGVNYNFSFTVNPSSAALTSVYFLETTTAASGLQGASVSLQVNGTGTHWAAGLTFASLGAGITVNRVVVQSATAAEVDITIPSNAGVGLTSVTMRTNGEIVSLANSFNVLPYTPSMSLSPSSGMIAVAPQTANIVNVTFNGNFTHFAQNQTIAAIDGNGVTIQNFKVLNAWTATAQFSIDQTAPSQPGVTEISQTALCTNIYGGNRIVTIETPLTSGSEIVETGFCVTSTPAVLTSISPYHSPEPVNNLGVTITGNFTHFESGVTTLGFGPNITVVPGSLAVISQTKLTATINIAANAKLGWRPVFVDTIDPGNFINEQLTIGFGIDPPASATLVSVSPNTAIQGQTGVTVQITGNLTNWSQFNPTTQVGTTAIFGTGISVNTLTINSTSSATAIIDIDPVNAPIGGSTVTMVTQMASGNEEVVSGPLFGVTASPATIIATQVPSRDPNAVSSGDVLYQGDIKTFNITGLQTHFLQGETTLDLGSDITVSSINVIDDTHLQCQVAVSYTATIGFRGLKAITNAEIAPSASDALNILAVQGVQVNITPTSAAQGTVFTMQVNGTNTHFTANNTTANFGNNNGVNVTNVAVVSQTQMNLTVQVAGTAYVGPYTLTITTTNLPIGPPPMSPQSTEQIILNNVLGIGYGAGIITTVTPSAGVGAQNSTGSITVVGQKTSFQTGVTTAAFSTGGCLPAYPAGVNVTNVTATDNLHATLSIAVASNAPTGYQTLCLYTLGEVVSYSNAFQILPGNPTLNEVSPVSGQQGQTVGTVASPVQILGQYTHWAQGVTTMTMGQGITVQNLTITSQTSATAILVIDGTAYVGSRTTTMTTNNEIVKGNFFSVTASSAIISTISPISANQGQHILLTINGNFTHWSQELTQFSINGGGGDITVNGLIISSPTLAIADLSISGTANLGTRSIYMSTVGENVVLQSGLLITGGIPSISSISPGYGTIGDVADNVIITGVYTDKVPWSASSVVDFGDPGITVTPIGSPSGSTFNSQFSITAVINIGATAFTGLHTVTVRTGNSVQSGQYYVYNKAAPPTPYISYEYPSVALVGQTLAVSLTGAYTNWIPGQTSALFGAGIVLNNFDVTGLNTAVANITIVPTAAVGPRTVTITTGTQQLTTAFYVTVGTPAITLVSTSTASQGETRLLDLVGQYTTWTDNVSGPTVFTFCSGITSVTNVQIFGPTAARLQVTVDPEAFVGYCPVTATTPIPAGGNEVANLGGGGYFYITPSTATITSVMPNTLPQNTTTPTEIDVTGFQTLWDGTTVFTFGGGVNVITKTLVDNTHYKLFVTTDLYANPGEYTLTATTGGQVARLNNAFVVTPGTPILLSTQNSSTQQGGTIVLGILSQYTNWTQANTTVSFPNGGVAGPGGVGLPAITVTSGQSISVSGVVLPTAYTGCGPVVVTTTGQIPPVLTLYSAFCITPGPAAVTSLVPNNLGQGQSLNGSTSPQYVAITGTNTHFAQGVTQATFGPGISVGTLTVVDATHAQATITVAANATPEANTVTLTTAGEIASDPSSFTIFAATPVLLDVFPNSGTQGQGPFDVCITGAFTSFVNGNTVADFGPGITVNSTTIPGTCTAPANATANITISPVALTNGTNHVRMITNLGGGAQQIAIWENASATTMYNFGILPGGASILSATPTAQVRQNDTGDVIKIIGSGTHFTLATPNLAFCTGVTPVGQVVVDDTHITATVNVGTFAPVGQCGLTVTTGGEKAIGTNLFTVLGGLPLITQVNPNSARQNDGQTTPVNVTITGLYTHFTSGALSAAFPAGVTVVNPPSGITDTSFTVGIKVDPAATPGAGSVTVNDTTDGGIVLNNGFTISTGTPALISVVPNTGGQGTNQTVTLTGSFTNWTSATSVVSISGGNDVTIGNPGTVTNLANGFQTLQVSFNVTNGAAATARNVTVTTGGTQVLTLNSAFTVLPGTTNISTISPNIGVNGQTNLAVTISGAFTHFAPGTTTANFGQGISVNGSTEGTAGTITYNSPTSATATITIDASQVNAPLGARNVTIFDPTDGSIVVNGGFTVQANTTTAPTIISVSPVSSASNVPTNTKVTVVFSQPMNPATITAGNTMLADTTVAGCYTNASNALAQAPGSPSLDVGGRILTMTLAGTLPVGRTFDLTVNSSNAVSSPIVSDVSGNHLNYNYCVGFTAGFTPDNSGPTFLSANMGAGVSGVPTNAPVILYFDKPINAGTTSGLTVMQAGNPVPGTWGHSNDYTNFTFTPSPALTAITTYTVGYSNAVTDNTGTPLTNPGSFTFTTAAGTDTTAASLVTYTPPSGATTGSNPTIRIVYNKPINIATVNKGTFYIYDQLNSATVQGTAISNSADNKTFTVTLPGQLLASTQYHVIAYTFYDWANNSVCCSQWTFETNAITTPDTTAPTVVSVSPLAGTTNVPVNPEVFAHFSEQLDPTSLKQSNITLTQTSPSVTYTGTVAFVSGDDSTVTFIPTSPSTLLNPSNTYTINVSGFSDQDGNPMAAYGGSSFTTGITGTADTTHGTISATPTSGSTNVPVNTNVVLSLNKPVDPLTVTSRSVDVYDQTLGSFVTGSTVVSADGKTLTYTPGSQWIPSHVYNIRGSYDVNLYDLAGNTFNYVYQTFTAGGTPDTTAPTVIGVSPLNSATLIGPTNPVIVTFSKSINPGTLSGNVAIYNGSTLYTSNYSMSFDNTTLVFSTGNLPFSTSFTVVVNPTVKDLAGNALGTEFSSTFSTGPQPAITPPSVTAMRPGSGATGIATTTPITFFMSAPMNPATITPSSLKVSQAGVLISGAGAIAVSPDGQDITFTPGGGSFTPGALIQVWFQSGATDTNGNPLTNFQSQFTIAPNLAATPVTAVSYTPGTYSSGNDRNTVIEILMSKPLNPATVTTANFYVTDSSSNSVACPPVLLDGGRLIRCQPSSELGASTYFYVHPTTGLQDINNLSYAGNTNYYFYTGATATVAAPSVAATAPTNGATSIGTNAVVSVTFSAPVDPDTFDPSTVTLSGGGSIPISISYNTSTYVMTITPQAPMPVSQLMTLTLNGVTDVEAHPLNPTPYQLQFTTGTGPDYAVPFLTQSNIANGQTGVPVTTSVSLTFNKPIDWRTVVYNSSIWIQDNTVGGHIAANLSPQGSNGILITPTAPNYPLSVAHTYQILACSIADLNGNSSGCYMVNRTFTTVLSAPAGGPVVTQIVPPNGSTGVPVNFQPQVQFDRPVNPLSLGSVTLKQGASTVSTTPVIAGGGTILTLVPTSILAPGASYTFTVTGVQDPAGNTQSGSVSRSFTTAGGIDLAAPSVSSITPINGSTTGENPLIQMRFSEPLNPIQTTGFTFYNKITGRTVNGSALSWAPDFKSVIFSYPGNLDPSSGYEWYLSTVYDLAGNTGSACCYSFTTNSSVVGSPEQVTSVEPPNNQGGVPLNGVMTLRLATPASPGSISSSSVSLSPQPAGYNVQLSSDGLTITLGYTGTLSASTTYTISVPNGGFTDQNNPPNGVSSFSSQFTTGSSTDSTAGTISLTDPAPASLGAALTQAITVTFSKPWNPNSLTGNYFSVCENQNCSFQIAGTVTTGAQPNTMVFTPAVALPANTRIDIYVGYNSTIYDLAGNAFSYLYDAHFSTANTADTTPPAVTSITPASGATNVGPNAPIAITFNKSLNYTTITTANFALYNGATLIATSVSYSSDRSVVYLSATLPYSSNLTVAVSTNVQDYNGNNMASPCSSPLTASCTYSFSTETQPITFNPSVIQARPGTGAAVTVPITLYMNSPMNLASAQNNLFVAQNGALIPGTASLIAGGQGIVWTPQGGSFAPGAFIEMWLNSPAADINGNVVSSYYRSYTTAAPVNSSTAFSETGYSPCRYCTSSLQNPVIEIAFSKPVNQATVTSATFYVKQTGSTLINGSITFPASNVIRFTPSPATLVTGSYYYVYMTTGIQDTFGNAFAGDNFYFYAGSTNDTTLPAVQYVTPASNSQNIGDNAPVKIVFSKKMDTLTITPATVSLQSGGNLPYTATFSCINCSQASEQTVVTLMPQVPLPDSSTVSVVLTSGISDLAGNAITGQTTTFQTETGADFSAAAVIQRSVDSGNNTNIPVNTTFTVVFNKPLDPSTVSNAPGDFAIYDYVVGNWIAMSPSTVSADGRTVTIASASNLAGGHNGYYYWCGATDLDGNAMTCGSQGFTESSATDTTAPTVISTNPTASGANVPTNAEIELIFSEPVRATNLGAITLKQGASTVAATAVLNNGQYTDDHVVRVIPQSLLLANTAYTVTVQGVQDVAGNTMSASCSSPLTAGCTYTFTTGSTFQLVGEQIPTTTVTTGTGTNTLPYNTGTPLPNVLDAPTFTFVFDHALDPAALTHGAFNLRDNSGNVIPGLTLNYNLSVDQKTVTVTTNGLASGATYYLYLGYYATLYDISGNGPPFSYVYYHFTTQ